MMMRITDNVKFNSIQVNIQRGTKNFFEANERVATGKNLINISDDPAAAREVLDLKNVKSSTDQYLKNMNRANSFIEATNLTLERVDELITQAWDAAVSGRQPEQRAAATIEITGTIDEMFSLANTKNDGKYIFSGFKTTTQPFDPSDPTYTYNGDTGSIEMAIDENRNMPVNVTGDTIFSGVGGGIDLFTELNNLKTALETDDESAIQSALATFQTAHDQVQNAAVLTASRHSQISSKMEDMQNFKSNLLSRISSIEDADPASAIIELTRMQTAYEVILSASTRLMQTSLMNFLG